MCLGKVSKYISKLYVLYLNKQIDIILELKFLGYCFSNIAPGFFFHSPLQHRFQPYAYYYASCVAKRP